MTTQAPQTIASLSAAEFEALLRRIVREEIRQVLRERPLNPVDDWSHEGPDDPEGDAVLLADALKQIEEMKQRPDDTISWEDFKAELKRAEEAGELPA